MSRKVIVCVFYANGTPNNEGELNYHKFEELAGGYKDYQKIVDGFISVVPGNEASQKHGIGCYCNEDGIALKLRENQLAQLCLEKLGFSVGDLYLSPPILGNVVIFHLDGDDDIEISLNETQIQLINKTVDECKSKWSGKKSVKIENADLTNEDSESSTDSGPTRGDNDNDDMDDDDPEYNPEDGDDNDLFDDDFFDEDPLKDENEVDKTVEYIEENSKTT